MKMYQDNVEIQQMVGRENCYNISLKKVGLIFRFNGIICVHLKGIRHLTLPNSYLNVSFSAPLEMLQFAVEFRTINLL